MGLGGEVNHSLEKLSRESLLHPINIILVYNNWSVGCVGCVLSGASYLCVDKAVIVICV